MLAGNLYETDPMFYLEGGAHGRLIRVQTIPGGVVVLDEVARAAAVCIASCSLDRQ